MSEVKEAGRLRGVYMGLTLAVIALGLASRRYPSLLPLFLHKSAGDGLWALMVFLICGMLFPRRHTLWVGAVAMTFSVCIEFSQIYHAPWIDSIRAYPLGHLILGSGFAWADMLAYSVGIAAGILGEILNGFAYRLATDKRSERDERDQS